MIIPVFPPPPAVASEYAVTSYEATATTNGSVRIRVPVAVASNVDWITAGRSRAEAAGQSGDLEAAYGAWAEESLDLARGAFAAQAETLPAD